MCLALISTLKTVNFELYPVPPSCVHCDNIYMRVYKSTILILKIALFQKPIYIHVCVCVCVPPSSVHHDNIYIYVFILLGC